jgi:two-component system, OmpR family, response regulator ChvI
MEKEEQLLFYSANHQSHQLTTKCKGNRSIMNKRVLIVDDEPDLTLSLKMTLEENGLKVNSFTDPLSALENYKEEAGMYDLLILDMKMPQMNGFELYRQIRKIDDKVKVCFLTAGEMDYEQFGKELFPPLENNAIFKSQLKMKL